MAVNKEFAATVAALSMLGAGMASGQSNETIVRGTDGKEYVAGSEVTNTAVHTIGETGNTVQILATKDGRLYSVPLREIGENQYERAGNTAFEVPDTNRKPAISGVSLDNLKDQNVALTLNEIMARTPVGKEQDVIMANGVRAIARNRGYGLEFLRENGLTTDTIAHTIRTKDGWEKADCVLNENLIKNAETDKNCAGMLRFLTQHLKESSSIFILEGNGQMSSAQKTPYGFRWKDNDVLDFRGNYYLQKAGTLGVLSMSNLADKDVASFLSECKKQLEEGAFTFIYDSNTNDLGMIKKGEKGRLIYYTNDGKSYDLVQNANGQFGYPAKLDPNVPKRGWISGPHVR